LTKVTDPLSIHHDKAPPVYFLVMLFVHLKGIISFKLSHICQL